MHWELTVYPEHQIHSHHPPRAALSTSFPARTALRTTCHTNSTPSAGRASARTLPPPGLRRLLIGLATCCRPFRGAAVRETPSIKGPLLVASSQGKVSPFRGLLKVKSPLRLREGLGSLGSIAHLRAPRASHHRPNSPAVGLTHCVTLLAPRTQKAKSAVLRPSTPWISQGRLPTVAPSGVHLGTAQAPRTVCGPAMVAGLREADLGGHHSTAPRLPSLQLWHQPMMRFSMKWTS